MNERIIIQFTLDGVRYPIGGRRDDGLVFDNELDAWPRRVQLNLVPRSETARYRMRRVREINSWPYPEFHLEIKVTDGNLVLSGVNANGLPGGDFWLSAEVEDLPSVADRYKVYLPDNGEATIQVQVRKDPRRVLVSPGTMDPEVIRVLTGSMIDGKDVAAWLTDPTPRSNRKACLLNLMAKLRSIPDDDTLRPLIREVNSVFFAGTERIYARVNAGFHENIQALTSDQTFYEEGSPKAPIHERLLSAAGASKETHRLLSYRQEGNTCMQAVVAVPRTPGGPYFADLDIDLGNPLQDVVGFITHMIELGGGPTDHLDLQRKLAGDKRTSPFLYYSVGAAAVASG